MSIRKSALRRLFSFLKVKFAKHKGNKMVKHIYTTVTETVTIEAEKPVTERLDELTGITQTLPPTLGDSLTKLMIWRGYTNEKLAERASLSEKTIQRMRSEPDYNPSLSAIVAVCIGLNLPPYLSYPLIYRAGLTFKATKTHTAYQLLLAEHWRDEVAECNRTLADSGIPRVGSA
jgi:DNA-binding XRE family transcriptional regulator